MTPDNKKEILTGFHKHEIYQINHEQPFLLASGQKSPLYVDHRKLWSIPHLRSLVTQAWAETLRPHLSDITSVTFAGTATAGIVPAYALAQYFQAPFVYIRSSSKGHGTKKMIEGILDSKNSIVIVDDMITTGGSLLQSAAHIPDQKQILCATSFTRSPSPDVDKNFASHHIPLVSVFTTDDLLNFQP